MRGRESVSDSQLVEGLLRTTIPFVEERVALVLQVGDAHLRRPESAGGEIAEAVEERDRLAARRRDVGRVGDLIEELPTLLVGAVDEALRTQLFAQTIDQGESAAH